MAPKKYTLYLLRISGAMKELLSSEDSVFLNSLILGSIFLNTTELDYLMSAKDYKELEGDTFLVQ